MATRRAELDELEQIQTESLRSTEARRNTGDSRASHEMEARDTIRTDRDADNASFAQFV